MKNLALPLSLLLLTMTGCGTPSDISELPSQHVTANDSTTLHYKTYGQGPRTVIFVHDAEADMNAWEAQYDALRSEKDLRMVFVDLPGFGQSGKPATAYSVLNHAEALGKVYEAEHFDYAYLVGQGLGAAVCRNLFAARPDRVAGLCVQQGDSVECMTISGLTRELAIQIIQRYAESGYADDGTHAAIDASLTDSIRTMQQRAIQNNLTCYEAGIYELEHNYAGFDWKVTDDNRAEYEQLKQEYRDSISMGAMYGPSGVAELCCYMQDFHLGCSFRMWSNRFPMQWPTYRQDMALYDPQPVAQKVDDHTFLLRFPTCMGDDEYVSWVWASVDEYRKSGCENLIVDVRGNGGGNDYQYYPIYRLLYAQPGITHGLAMINTQDVRDRMRTAAIEAGNEWWAAKMDSAEAHQDQRWYQWFDYKHDLIVDEGVDPRRPRQAAIIIDRSVASSGEQLLIDVKSVAPDVKLYGRDNSLGCIDFSNVVATPLPGSPNDMHMPGTVSNRVLDGQLIDGHGIEPDVRIPLPLPDTLSNNIDTWVLWVAEQMGKS